MSSNGQENISFSVKKGNNEIKILKVFEFHSQYQAMSVLAQINNEKELYFFMKGANEKIKTKCKEVPLDCDSEIEKYSF